MPSPTNCSAHHSEAVLLNWINAGAESSLGAQQVLAKSWILAPCPEVEWLSIADSRFPGTSGCRFTSLRRNGAEQTVGQDWNRLGWAGLDWNGMTLGRVWPGQAGLVRPAMCPPPDQMTENLLTMPENPPDHATLVTLVQQLGSAERLLRDELLEALSQCSCLRGAKCFVYEKCINRAHHLPQPTVDSKQQPVEQAACQVAAIGLLQREQSSPPNGDQIFFFILLQVKRQGW